MVDASVDTIRYYSTADSEGNSEVNLASSCLAGLERVDLNIVNTQTANSVSSTPVDRIMARFCSSL